MWRKFNSKGFTLIEVSIALLVLFTALSTFIPIGTSIYLERITIREQYQALEFLNERLLAWRFDGIPTFDAEILINETSYQLTSSYTDGSGLTLCLQWVGRNNRSYEQCAFAKR
ncbi:MAG TPA: type II secretion system protein [Bacilli bacterium]|nr:type II secretion system protein [Bacilli bacterium]